MIEPMPGERGQDKKIKEMVENIRKLKEDVEDLKESFEDISLGQVSIIKLLERIEKNV